MGAALFNAKRERVAAAGTVIFAADRGLSGGGTGPCGRVSRITSRLGVDLCGRLQGGGR